MKLPLCWLCALTRITYLSKLIGISPLAAWLQLQLFWVQKRCPSYQGTFFICRDQARVFQVVTWLPGHGLAA
ncbi:hypothetical protein D4100_20635 [Serratia inhibens]|uniref:Uncharacterized protein n=1 Tax=Serratia inhibens TaxID=2338073 RepID=A0AA93BUW3_9GAMM|nr:hypothetical protein D4100_20635 [Serratia inhibens]